MAAHLDVDREFPETVDPLIDISDIGILNNTSLISSSSTVPKLELESIDPRWINFTHPEVLDTQEITRQPSVTDAPSTKILNNVYPKINSISFMRSYSDYFEKLDSFDISRYTGETWRERIAQINSDLSSYMSVLVEYTRLVTSERKECKYMLDSYRGSSLPMSIIEQLERDRILGRNVLNAFDYTIRDRERMYLSTIKSKGKKRLEDSQTMGYTNIIRWFMKTRCLGIKPNDERCCKPPQRGSQYCHGHQNNRFNS